MLECVCQMPVNSTADTYPRDFSRCLHLSVQAAEVEQLKLKLKQYSDYDEIKRELEIMKVRPLSSRLFLLTVGAVR